MPDFAEVPLLIAFINLNRYTAQIDQLDDSAVAGVMASYYEYVGAAAAAAGGRVIKFIGDAALVVFPPTAADRAVLTLLELKEGVDRLMADHGWDCRAIAKVHFGTVAAGMFGARDELRYDILGKAVNIAARLESQSIAISAEAFRQLGPEVRQRFKKHTPPITYIRQEDTHRPRWSKRA